MRVLFWSELFWPFIGGAEIIATRLIPALQERGYEFIVVTRHDSPDLPTEDQYRGIPIHRFPFWTGFEKRDVDQLIALRQKVTELKRSFAPDLVHIHGCAFIALFHLDTMSAYPAPLLVTLINELPNHKVEREWWGRVMRAADWVTGKAPVVIEQACELVPEIRERSSVIANGLEVPLLRPEPLAVDPPRLLCLGRLDPQKGFDVAISAMTLLSDRFPQLRLVIAGDGPERSKLERHIAELGLTEKVELVGWVAPDKVPALINTSMAVLMPSRYEGLPSVALQAGVMARPLVATEVGGLREVIVDRQTGIVVEPEDSEGVAEAVAFLVEHPEEATRMGQNARRRVQSEFSWQRCVDAYDRLYQKLINEKIMKSGAIARRRVDFMEKR